MAVIKYKSATLYVLKDNHGYTVEYSWNSLPSVHYKGGRGCNPSAAIRLAKLTVDACINTKRIENKFLSMKLR